MGSMLWGNRQWANVQTAGGAVPVVSNPAGTVTSASLCLSRAAALHPTGTTQWSCCQALCGGLRELLGAAASWPSTQLQHWAARKLRMTPVRWFSLTAKHNSPASCSHCSRALCKLSGVSAATGTSSEKTRVALLLNGIWGSKGGFNVILGQQCHLPQVLSSSQSSSLVRLVLKLYRRCQHFKYGMDWLAALISRLLISSKLLLHW